MKAKMHKCHCGLRMEDFSNTTTFLSLDLPDSAGLVVEEVDGNLLLQLPPTAESSR